MNPHPSTIPARLGKFEVQRTLGSGAQSTVYLAHDPDLRRNVAIKLLANNDGADAVRREARIVGRLKHPNIVPIHELGEYQGKVYLVFECVEGRTLQQALARDGAFAPRRAAELLVAILDACSAAHAEGVIHRDLKPSNILLDAEGRPHVTDFGIATRPSPAPALDGLLGSPAYMAPEYIKNRSISAQYDVFSAGLILYEMLFGQRAVQGDNSFQAIHQIANVALEFPAAGLERIGPVLHDIVAKATAKEPEQRYVSAGEMQKALQQYLNPAQEVAAPANHQSTLDFLMRRMLVKGDFPAMSAAMTAIQRMASSNQASVSTLSNSILKDFALTNKILRLVNSAYYANRSGERIRTVTRAIVMMGLDAVRSMAISLMLFDRIRDKQHAGALREEFLRANVTGMLARELCGRINPTQAEEAFICALFHNLGRLLAYYYFWEEAEAIRRLVATGNSTEQQASLRVLGISYTDLGIGVAQAWGFPDSITRSMRGIAEGKVQRSNNVDIQLAQIATLADEIRSVLENSAPAVRTDALKRLEARYGDSLSISNKDFERVVQRSVACVTELTEALDIDLHKTRIGQRIVEPAQSSMTVAGKSAATPETTDFEPASASTPEEILSAGIQEISKAQIDDMPIDDLLHIVAETAYRALGARRVLMCMRDGRSNVMQARFGFGADVDELMRKFFFTLNRNDIFNAILSQDTGVLIRDSSDAKINSRLPGWYVQHVNAPTFIVFPINIRKVSVAMIYADMDTAGAIKVSGKELSLLHTLRNQALLALKQVG